MNKHIPTGLPALLIVAVTLLCTACGGSQMKMLAERPLKPLPSTENVNVYIGEIRPPYQEIAIIESTPYSYSDATIKKAQLEQLKAKARKLGANAVQGVHILSKRVKGYTIDERVPFTAWQQGQYELYFMRGTAIRVAEADPVTLEQAKPLEGWAVDKLMPPPRLGAPVTPPAATVTATTAPQAVPQATQAVPQATQAVPQATQAVPQATITEMPLPPPPQPVQ